MTKLFKNKTFLVNNFSIIFFTLILVYFNASLKTRIIDGFIIIILGIITLFLNYYWCYYHKKQ